MKFVQDVIHLLGRQVRLTMRMPVFLVMSIVQPIVWMVLFSQLFGKAMSGFISAGGSSSYVQFLAPGIAIMSSLFGSGYAGMGLLNDIDRGVMDRMLATPVTRVAIIVARVVHTGVTAMIQSMIILTVAMVLGARPASIPGLLLLLLAAGMMGAGMSGISYCIAILTRKQEAMFAIMNFTMLPMIYLSSAIMIKNMMPPWIKNVCKVNPVDWAVTIARTSFQGGPLADAGWQMLWLVAFTTAFTLFASLAFRRYRASM